MNPFEAGPLFWALVVFVVATAGIAIAAGYFGRPKARRAFPGGARRYLAALAVQALGFVLPIPFVWLWLLDVEPQGLNTVAAFAAGMVTLFILRALPGTGPLLTDLGKPPQQAKNRNQPR